MLTHHKNLNRLSLTLCGAIFLSTYAYADSGAGPFGPETHTTEHPLDMGLIERLTGFDYNETNFMKSLGVRFGGWTEIGFGGNIDNPKGTNGPVTFNDGPNEFKLQQVYGFIEREADTLSDTISFGFRADLMYGTDARFSTSSNFDTNILNSDNQRKLIFPQVYGEVFLPFGNGITAQIGHFYTLIGYEVVPSTGNFFFSHAYAMQYGEPFTHTGALLSYPVNDNITVRGGAVTGWDAHFDQPVNFLGSIAYTTDDEATSLTAAIVTGDVETGGPAGSSGIDHNRTMYSVVLEHDITEKLHYVLQHDLGVEEKTSQNGAAQWYGVNQYLFYDILHNLGAGLRMEWFRDDDGVRVVGNGIGENFIGVTGGLNYTPIAGFTIRPEVRYDRSTKAAAFDDGKDDDQIMLSVSGIFRF